MRAALALVALLLLPAASAEFGPYGEDGWPINVDGGSTNPFPGVSAAALAAAFSAEPPLNRVGGTTVYPYWPILTAEVQRLAADHPDKVKLTSYGKSTAGLDLWMLEIADHARIEAGDGLPLDEREVVWVDGGTHSNEYSGVYFTLAWAQFLLDEYDSNETAKWIVENRHTWIMPMVNPDGSHAFGRLNANLVNINRNYPVVWDGQGNDFLMNNRGPYPASEVETQATINGYNATLPDYMASVHCCGNLWLFPYGEEGVDPPPHDLQTLTRVCEEAFPDVRDDCGPIWSTIYPASGSSVDTAYEYSGAVAFGYEMSGRGAVAFWGQPLTFSDVKEQEYESWQGLEHAFMNVHKYGAYPELYMVSTNGDKTTITFRNDGYGNLTAGWLYLCPTGDELCDPAGIEMPFIPAGGTGSVTVPFELDEMYDITVQYQKREMASPMGHRTWSGSLQIVHAEPTAEAPWVPGVLALAGLMLVAGRRRS